MLRIESDAFFNALQIGMLHWYRERRGDTLELKLEGDLATLTFEDSAQPVELYFDRPKKVHSMGQGTGSQPWKTLRSTWKQSLHSLAVL